MARMVRKQLYLRKEQDKRLKQAAERLGVAEAEFVRQALDRALAPDAAAAPAAEFVPDLTALDELMAGLRERHAAGPLPGKRDWTREEIYAERTDPDRHQRPGLPS
jgi:hypothetical protein